ncbi:PEP/pyruvate-binding domain-containing protein [Desulfitobacterium sp. Sab5]|uniref:PEP/pyruvate-binding domain-containing protein n=1 Tax=Desulfitobacterium nosdiversum TaxID=3375356 RepID=UPI003CED3CDA
MKQWVCFFSELGSEEQPYAGGKGSTLARLYKKGYSVPNGFIIMPSAFDNNELTPEARADVQTCFTKMRKDYGDIVFAVRSSGLSEDSVMASFAGQFGTVLNVCSDDELWEAIRTVRQSRHSNEVQAYSEVKGINVSHEMAVVVQRMVQAEISGVLFTANPVTGNCNEMMGNFIVGLGENLVSGKADSYTFILERQSSTWQKVYADVPRELRQYASKLRKLGNRLEKELGCPQDIEWAINGSKLYVLQSRPITTLTGYNPATGEWNDSMTGSYLWSNVNFGEAIPEVMTPLTWTVQSNIYESWELISGYQSSGNIGGRIYLNLSIYASVLHSLRRSKEDILRFLEGLLYTRIPENMDIPVIRISKTAILSVIYNLIKMYFKQNTAVRKSSRFLATNSLWCDRIREKIQRIKNKDELSLVWDREILPHLKNTVWYVMGSVTQFSGYAMKLRRELTELVGADDADTLISGLSSNSDVKDGSRLLASLGPVLGISKVSCGEMERAEYLALYGHRGPNEFELSVPRPVEDSDWLDQQLIQFKKSPVDIEALLLKKHDEFDAAWNRFATSNRLKAHFFRRRIRKMALKARMREAVRSEYVRDRWVARNFALRAGELIGIGDDIFFLTIDEVLDVLSGNKEAVKFIPARKEIHQRYLELPAYPSIICGRFDPFHWAVDPQRRNDIYDSSGSSIEPEDSSLDSNRNIITGSAGSGGRIEGVVRCLNRIEEGEQLEEGEILVTSQTDIAWTPLFPRAAAVITDVGAPLSHAAVIARELGIPAVVGCGNATMYLRTGDRVFVDGGQGIVKILSTNREIE